MPLISGTHDRKQVFFQVALVSVKLNAEPFFAETESSADIFSEPVKALVDTGATSTSIAPNAARRLNLRSTGKRDIMTANGVRRARCYDFQIAFMDAGASGDGDGSSPLFVLPGVVSGAELNPDKFAFDILLGMDVISQGDLMIRRDGFYSFEF